MRALTVKRWQLVLRVILAVVIALYVAVWGWVRVTDEFAERFRDRTPAVVFEPSAVGVVSFVDVLTAAETALT